LVTAASKPSVEMPMTSITLTAPDSMNSLKPGSFLR
jgi:hypothetical protein